MESEQRRKKRAKKERWKTNAPEDAKENREFIKKGGGIRPSF